MIDIEMRADHRVDRVGRASGCGELLEKRPLATVPLRPATRLVVAHPGIDDDPSRRRFDQERMDAHPDPPRLKTFSTALTPMELTAGILSGGAGVAKLGGDDRPPKAP
jgi:hypothetical protein